MKKNARNMWIYMAVLFSIAIVLILITTLTQSKIVDHEGNLSVLGSFTATSSEKISNLQNENYALQTEKEKLSADLTAASAALDEQKMKTDMFEKTVQEEQALKLKVAELYKAYEKEDIDTMKTLISQLTETQVEDRIPGLYKNVQRKISE